ncbi:MAG: hypothetical protein H6611_10395, partial [Ignavibacteriales bacterium]|nr:hypothetical protein [Ignavibacteriales bacterium]
MIRKFLFTALLGLSAIASSLTIDSQVPAIKIKDQFEKEHTIDANVKT